QIHGETLERLFISLYRDRIRVGYRQTEHALHANVNSSPIVTLWVTGMPSMPYTRTSAIPPGK
ncbi:MAG: hypothetical protein AAGI63_04830, partial [Planctomycetota bacterium]